MEVDMYMEEDPMYSVIHREGIAFHVLDKGVSWADLRNHSSEIGYEWIAEKKGVEVYHPEYINMSAEIISADEKGVVSIQFRKELPRYTDTWVEQFQL